LETAKPSGGTFSVHARVIFDAEVGVAVTLVGEFGNGRVVALAMGDIDEGSLLSTAITP